MDKKWRYYICMGCRMQTASMTVDSDRVVHVYCGEEMAEVSGRLPAKDFCKTYDYRIEKEETVKFEVGDKVSVQGTVHHRCDDGTYSLVIPYGAKGDGFRSQRNFESDQMTLVERPKKFEVGKKYRFPRTTADYMYLGESKWYSYRSEEVLDASGIDTGFLVELDS